MWRVPELSQAPFKRLLLLGGGHAHLNLLRRLRTEAPRGWQVTMVSPHSRQIYSGMLPGWVAGRYALEDCAISLAGLCERAGIAFAQTAATGLDLLRNEVLCADGERRRFDLVSVDTGPEPALADLPGATDHALPVRPIEGFIKGWPDVQRRWRDHFGPFEVVVVGSGAAAVELAFAIRTRASREGASDVRICMVGATANRSPAQRAARAAASCACFRRGACTGAGTARQCGSWPRALSLSTGPCCPSTPA